MAQPKQRTESEDPRHTAEDSLLAERLRAADEDAFAEIYVAFFPRVFSFCLGKVGNAAEAEDLAQETFLQLYRSLPSFEGRSSLLTWTFGIAHNVCSRYFRHCSRWMVGHRNALELDDRPVEPVIERHLDAIRVLKYCERVLASTRRPAHQEIFRLRYAETQSIRSIAEQVGKSKEAVTVSLRRSRMALTNGVPELALVLDNTARSA